MITKVEGTKVAVTFSLPDIRAKARLMDIADLMEPGWRRYNGMLSELERNPAGPDGGTGGRYFFQKLEQIQNGYWSDVVLPHLDEIARLTNNSTTTLASVMRPKPSVMDLGGVLPPILRRMGNGSGSWR